MKIANWILGCMLVSACFIACDDDDNSNDVITSLPIADQNFVQTAALSNMTEVEFGEIASTRGSDSAVRAFGQQMVTEHTNAQEELEDIANDYNNVNWPEDLDSAHQVIREQLLSLSGYSFDTLYMNTQVADHQMTLNLFNTELTAGTVQRVKAYATKYRPHIEEHLERADSVRNTIIGQQSAISDGN